MKASLHAKDLGSLGEISVAQYLIRRGLPVFVEYGDNSKVDIFTIKNDKPIAIQVKAINPTDRGSIRVSLNKSGPNYQYTYTEKDFQILAVYVPTTQDILFIPITMILKVSKSGFNVRLTPAKNNQTKNTRFVGDFKSFNKAVKYVNGEDILYKERISSKKKKPSRKFMTDLDVKKFKKLCKNGYSAKEAANKVGFHVKSLTRRAR